MLRAAIVASAASLCEGAVVDVKSILNVSGAAKASFDRSFRSVMGLMGSSDSSSVNHGECKVTDKAAIKTAIADLLCSNADAGAALTTAAMWTALKTAADSSQSDFDAEADGGSGANQNPSIFGEDASGGRTGTYAANLAWNQALPAPGSENVGIKAIIFHWTRLMQGCTVAAKDMVPATDSDMVCQCHEDEDGKRFAKLCSNLPDNCLGTDSSPPAVYFADKEGHEHSVEIPVTDAHTGIGITSTLLKQCQHHSSDCAKDSALWNATKTYGDEVTGEFATAWTTAFGTPAVSTNTGHVGCYWLPAAQ